MNNQKQPDNYEAILDASADFAFAPDPSFIGQLLLLAVQILILYLSLTALECAYRNTRFRSALLRNLMFLVIGGIAYVLMFNLMYPTGDKGFSFFSLSDLGIGGSDSEFSYGGSHLALTALADLAFQTLYALTFVSLFYCILGQWFGWLLGAIISLLLGGIIYPSAGRLHWGQGFLSNLGYYDYTGGMMIYGLAGAALLGFALFPAGKNINSNYRPAYLWIATGAIVINYILVEATYSFNTAILLIGPIISVIVGLILFRKFTPALLFFGLLSQIIVLSNFGDLLSVSKTVVLSWLAGAIWPTAYWLIKKGNRDELVSQLGVTCFTSAVLGASLPTVWLNNKILPQLIGIFVYSTLGLAAGILLGLVATQKRRNA